MLNGFPTLFQLSAPARKRTRAAIVAISTFALAWASLRMQAQSVVVVAIWLPSGAGLAAILAWGRWMVVPIFLGNATCILLFTKLSPLLTTGVGAADALEALVAATIVQRIGATLEFARTRCVVGLAVAAPVAACASASIIVALLEQADQLTSPAAITWIRYWMSTVVGMFLLTPLLLTWLRDPWRRFGRRRLAEAVSLTSLLAAASWLVFVHEDWVFLKLLLVVPLFSWAIVRFGARGTIAAITLFAIIAIYGMHDSNFALQGLEPNQTIDLIQVLIALFAVTTLVMASALGERHEALERLSEIIDTFNHSEQIANSGTWEYRFGSDGLTWSSDGLTWCSNGMTRLLSIEPSSDHMVPLDRIVAALSVADQERFVGAVQCSIETGATFEFEQHIVGPTGERVLAHVIAPVTSRSSDGNGRLVGSVVDVTQARAIEAFKDDLIATASHELRTPLTSIVGFADTLIGRWDDVPEPKRRSYVEIIDKQAHRLERIVEDTLMQSKVDSGALASQVRPFLVNRAVRNALGHPVDDGVLLDTEPGLMAIGQPDHLERVLDNLLSNARKYGEPPIRIIAIGRGANEVELRVEDHGPGVSHSFRTRLFDRFERGRDVGTTPGTGLGLSICKGLVEAMGGRIGYERWRGITAFVIRLPRVEGNEPVEEIRDPEHTTEAR